MSGVEHCFKFIGRIRIVIVANILPMGEDSIVVLEEAVGMTSQEHRLAPGFTKIGPRWKVPITDLFINGV